MNSAPRRWSLLFCATLLSSGVLLALLLPGGSADAAATQITRVSPGQHEVALTFDADAWPGRITSILNTLRAHHDKITFFLTGPYLVNFPTNTRAINAAGHEIASHGYDHRDYRALGNAAIQQRLDHWQTTFKNLTGKSGPLFWRAPYGYSDSRVRQAALDDGYKTIYWTLDALDTVGAVKSKKFVINRVLNTSWVNLDGAIILLHVNANGTVEALDTILSTLEARGLKVVTVSELMRR